MSSRCPSYPGAALVLAGGRGRRVGRPKALLPYGSGTFLSTILDRLGQVGLAWVGAVLPIDLSDQSLHLGKANILINQRPDDGQLSSLRLALSHGLDHYPWILVALVDQPAVALSTYQELCRSTRHPAHMWVPVFGERRGHPVIFGSEMYQDLREGPLDQGARWAVARHIHSRLEIPIADQEVLLDVDTPADLKRLEKA